MANKTNKKGGFSLNPIKLSEPIKATDGFTNLVETTADNAKKIQPQTKKNSEEVETKKREVKTEVAKNQNSSKDKVRSKDSEDRGVAKINVNKSDESEKQKGELSLSTGELLRILDADSLDEIYELTDVLRASSLKLYATLTRLADSRGRARVKNHELMSKAGIKGRPFEFEYVRL